MQDLPRHLDPLKCVGLRIEQGQFPRALFRQGKFIRRRRLIHGDAVHIHANMPQLQLMRVRRQSHKEAAPQPDDGILIIFQFVKFGADQPHIHPERAFRGAQGQLRPLRRVTGGMRNGFFHDAPDFDLLIVQAAIHQPVPRRWHRFRQGSGTQKCHPVHLDQRCKRAFVRFALNFQQLASFGQGCRWRGVDDKNRVGFILDDKSIMFLNHAGDHPPEIHRVSALRLPRFQAQDFIHRRQFR